ncbi:MAG: HU family DNA-binding protein [Muribaculaceae bacterium]|nr:HU family DNA-binding protein [Muribaculaceae bacterium]
MNNKITLSRLIALLAEKSGKDTKICEEVLKSFFRNISAALENGESVKINGLGVFKVSMMEARKSVDVTSGTDNEIPAHGKVVFIPAKELAEAVNAPFEMFETIELDEEILEEDLMTAEAEGNQILATTEREEIILEEEKRDELVKEYPDIEKIMESTDASDDDSDDNSTVENSDQDSDENVDQTSDKIIDDNDEIELDASGHSETDVEHEESAGVHLVGDETDNTASEGSQSDDAEHASEEIVGDKTVDPEPVDNDDTGAEEIIRHRISEENQNAKEKKSHTVSEYRPVSVKVRSGRSFGNGFIWGMIGALIIFLIGIAVLWWVNEDFANWGRGVFNHNTPKSEEEVPQDTVRILGQDDDIDNADNTEAQLAMEGNDLNEAEDGVPDMVEDVVPENVVPTKPSDTKVTYDTITTTHYLTTMAKKHYGNYHLWPYIYKENEKILGHPNRIRPGTRIVIPDLKKYGVDPNNPKDIDKAKKMGTEIYNRYK